MRRPNPVTWILTRRKILNLEQQKVAEACGVTRLAVHNWEDGTNYPTTRMYHALAMILRVPVNELVWQIAQDKRTRDYWKTRDEMESIERSRKSTEAAARNAQAK